MAFKPPKPPDGCVDADEHERRLTASADALEERGQRLLNSDGRIDVATGNQCLVSAIAARKAAARLALERLEKDYTNWLVQQQRDLRQRAQPKPERPRLKRKGEAS